MPCLSCFGYGLLPKEYSVKQQNKKRSNGFYLWDAAHKFTWDSETPLISDSWDETMMFNGFDR